MKRALWALAAIAMVLVPIAAFGVGTASTSSIALPVVDPSVADPGAVAGVFSTLAKAFHGHQWTLVAGLVLTLFVVGLRVFETFEQIPPEYVPWFTMAIATGTSMAVGLQTHQSLMTCLSTGLLVGVAAVGGWESFGKLVRGIVQHIKDKLEARTVIVPVPVVVPVEVPPITAPPAAPGAPPADPPSGTPPPAGG